MGPNAPARLGPHGTVTPKPARTLTAPPGRAPGGQIMPRFSLKRKTLPLSCDMSSAQKLSRVGLGPPVPRPRRRSALGLFQIKP